MEMNTKICYTQLRLTVENSTDAHTSYISPEWMDYSTINSQKILRPLHL